MYSLKNNSKAFSLLEILIVMGIIGSTTSMILNSVRFTDDGKVGIAIREFAGTSRAAYESSIFSNELHRLCINVSNAEYWVEKAPPFFSGRPPSYQNVEAEERFIDERNKIIEELERKRQIEKEEAARENSEMKQEEPNELADLIDNKFVKQMLGANNTFESENILVSNISLLKPKKFVEIDDMVMSRKKLPGNLFFVKMLKEGTDEPVIYDKNNKNQNICVYYLPNGDVEKTWFHLAFVDDGGKVIEEDLKYTLTIDSLTGQIGVQNGFVEESFNQKQ